MNREKKEQADARDERLRHAQETGEFVDSFTTEPKQPIIALPSFMDALNQRRANRGQKPL